MSLGFRGLTSSCCATLLCAFSNRMPLQHSHIRHRPPVGSLFSALQLQRLRQVRLHSAEPMCSSCTRPASCGTSIRPVKAASPMGSSWRTGAQSRVEMPNRPAAREPLYAGATIHEIHKSTASEALGAAAPISPELCKCRLDMHDSESHFRRPIGRRHFIRAANQIILRRILLTSNPTGWPLPVRSITAKIHVRFGLLYKKLYALRYHSFCHSRCEACYA